MNIICERLTASGRAEGVELRAEAVFVQTDGQSRGAARINRFYREGAELWLKRCAEALPASLPQGRYLARLGMTIDQMDEAQLCVTVRWQLCRRGRLLEAETFRHRWVLPRGFLLPSPRKKSGKQMKNGKK